MEKIRDFDLPTTQGELDRYIAEQQVGEALDRTDRLFNRLGMTAGGGAALIGAETNSTPIFLMGCAAFVASLLRNLR